MIEVTNRKSKKGTTTEAELVQEKMRNGEMEPFKEWTTNLLISFKVNWWIRDDDVWKNAFPPVGSTEIDTCQPFVTKILSSFTEAVIPRNKVGSLSAVRGSSDDIYLTSTVDITAHRTVSYGSRKPDVVLYETGCRGACSITLIGDVKKRSPSSSSSSGSGGGDFSDQEKGHVLDMGFDLMDIQKHRLFLICFLTDGFRFQFFYIERRESGTYYSQYSAVHIGVNGWQVRAWIHTCKHIHTCAS